MTDPWINRAEKMKCSTCMWYVIKSRDSRLEDPSVPPFMKLKIIEAGLSGSRVGRCRRHSPTMVGYPVVKSDDWCGDHRLDENKA